MSTVFPSGLKIYEVFISEFICSSHLGQITGQAFLKNQTSRYKHHHGAENGNLQLVQSDSLNDDQKAEGNLQFYNSSSSDNLKGAANTGMKYHHHRIIETFWLEKTFKVTGYSC